MKSIKYESYLSEKLQHQLEVYLEVYNEWVDMMNLDADLTLAGMLNKLETIQDAFNSICYGYGLSNLQTEIDTLQLQISRWGTKEKANG